MATRADTRKGLNGTFSYQDEHGKRLFRFRCGRVQWGFTSVYDESEARMHRSMYPHQVTTQPFQVTALCKGYDERKALMDWMREYAEFIAIPDSVAHIKMTVSVPSRNFLQVGVIKSGIEYGDHLGSMLWQVNFTFECAYDPLDTKAAVHASYFDFVDADVLLKESLYFYPQTDANTLRGQQVGSDFTPIIEPVIDIGAVTYNQVAASTDSSGAQTSTSSSGQADSGGGATNKPPSTAPSAAGVEVGQLSPDKQWAWDGSMWRALKTTAGPHTSEAKPDYSGVRNGQVSLEHQWVWVDGQWEALQF